MFMNTYQSGFLSLLFSLGSHPLQLWSQDGDSVEGNAVVRVRDEDIQSSAIELRARDISTLSIACPADPLKSLGITLPYFVMVVKNMQQCFSFEVQVLDDNNTRRRLRCSNFQAESRIQPHICTMPLALEDGWNTISLDLPDLVRRVWGTRFTEALRVQIHPTCRLRRVYFAETLCPDSDLPPELRLYKRQ